MVAGAGAGAALTGSGLPFSMASFMAGSSHFLATYLACMNSRICLWRVGSGSGNSEGVHLASQILRALSLPMRFSFSISSGLNVAMEIILMRCPNSRLVKHTPGDKTPWLKRDEWWKNKLDATACLAHKRAKVDHGGDSALFMCARDRRAGDGLKA